MSVTKPDALVSSSPRPAFPSAGFNSALTLPREGYDFAANRFERPGADAFETRIGLAKAVFMRGKAARLFFSERARGAAGDPPRP